MVEAAHLLADAERPARIAAARAVGYSTNADVGVPLLRLKLLAAPDEPVVVSACLAALLELGSDESIEFVAGYLADDDPAIAEAAAMALGESRLGAALASLREMAEDSVTQAPRRIAMLAIAMLRNDDAWGFLLETIASEPAGPARDALSALSIYRYDDALCARIESAAEGRDDLDLSGLRSHES
jgi:HEAT repeat protein